MKTMLNTMIDFLQFVTFSLLLFLRPVIGVVLRLTSSLCLFGFLFCLLFASTQPTPLWAFSGTGIAATMLLLGYDAVLSRLAPDGYVIITER